MEYIDYNESFSAVAVIFTSLWLLSLRIYLLLLESFPLIFLHINCKKLKSCFLQHQLKLWLIINLICPWDPDRSLFNSYTCMQSEFKFWSGAIVSYLWVVNSKSFHSSTWPRFLVFCLSSIRRSTKPAKPALLTMSTQCKSASPSLLWYYPSNPKRVKWRGDPF